MKICHYHRYNDRDGACVLTSPPWNPDACWGVRTTVLVISKASVSLRFADVLWFSSLSYRGLLFLRKSASPLQFTHHLFGADKGLARELQVLELWRNRSQGHLDPICACNRYRWNIKHLIILLTQETAKKNLNNAYLSSMQWLICLGLLLKCLSHLLLGRVGLWITPKSFYCYV